MLIIKFQRTPISRITLLGIFSVASFTLLLLVINTNTLLATGGGTAVSADLLSGKTATVDSGLITGTMPNKVGSATVITPTASDQAIPIGYYGGALGDGKVAGVANASAGNIKSGVTIAGVTGTYNNALTVSVGAVQAFSGNTRVTHTGSTSMTYIKRYTMNIGGTYRINWDFVNWQSHTAYAQIYVNGSARGVYHTNAGGSAASYTEDITVNAGDELQFAGAVSNSGDTISIFVNYSSFSVATPFITTVLDN